ncbi:MAG: hypothetical protein COS92_08735 [Desulfobacterales bacterium CG07_land_8_20_14_0_80_52_14]|nr:MAG: hypothetical protein COX20_02330 [Desulfobacterales bacterium CG23_combo_of_CG06-09_8_20_14_all_52_9]PIU49045.1 MAG: hypothetical protein COS92_08735 [Desulfobacterales bacterium CG07_land_8_20_14_0_80_52_14]
MKRESFIRKLTVFFCCMLVIAFISACGGQPPKQEIDASKAALQAAISGGAEQFAPDALKAAQDLMAKLDSQIEKKDYKAAKLTAIQVKEAADKAKAAIEAGKAKAKETSNALVNEINQGVEKAKGLIAEAEAAKIPADLLQPIKDQLVAAETGIGELSGMISEGKFNEIQGKATAIKDQLGQLEQGIADAKAKAEELIKAPAAKLPEKKK